MFRKLQFSLSETRRFMLIIKMQSITDHYNNCSRQTIHNIKKRKIGEENRMSVVNSKIERQEEGSLWFWMNIPLLFNNASSRRLHIYHRFHIMPLRLTFPIIHKDKWRKVAHSTSFQENAFSRFSYIFFFCLFPWTLYRFILFKRPYAFSAIMSFIYYSD